MGQTIKFSPEILSKHLEIECRDGHRTEDWRSGRKYFFKKHWGTPDRSFSKTSFVWDELFISKGKTPTIGCKGTFPMMNQRTSSNEQERTGAADRVLLAAVSPDPGKRRMVGQGFYRMDEYGESETSFQRSLPTARSRRPRVLRPSPSGDTNRPGRHGARIRDRRLSAITTTGLPAIGSLNGLSTRCWLRASRISRFVYAGRTRPGPEYGTAHRTGY